MHLKLRFRHADSSRIRESQNPNGHSIPCGQLIPKKAACVFETARYGPFLNLKLFSRAYYTRAASKTIMRI
ncbi:hypothetical protein OKW30_000968 [Paraburkholderia sp. Clong3]|uniref:Uncharacterized protein n=1 Tax=Paraburkholderia tuberum TaxID=157910 RepID=A0A1H1AQ15_9BURK|nr:hypothetical protein [Paraburkholderia sp. HC6.4b]MBB5451265.1 hypothetical protein [Paraburkholderia sp. Kb1A]MBB5470693.1 hypothetical protein [Paraburkholderia sp. CI2]MBB5498321.1 hypothetical protein [Paraburkholderia sp. MM5384-R2]MBC8733122.1 hypothetical protein [Paraburkholderia sp. UCT2]MBC8737461.1 hypothetical protein [Paraburkholderia sp. UCT31]MDH6150663.1 hypothetical protein [Paraburkholderia sp. WSM4179]SDQ41714.1 hypothetical protein SAMN05445850_0566 [Paraburkholderia t